MSHSILIMILLVVLRYFDAFLSKRGRSCENAGISEAKSGQRFFRQGPFSEYQSMFWPMTTLDQITNVHSLEESSAWN